MGERNIRTTRRDYGGGSTQTGRMTFRDTVDAVPKAISVRLDDEALAALRSLESHGQSRSDVIRAAIIETARRQHSKQELAAEVRLLEADDVDRAEMLEVAEMMESLRAQG